MAPPPPALLVVEDDEDTAAALLEALRAEGFSVEAVGDGQAARDLLARASGPPRLILLDLMLPHLSGEDLLAWLRQQPAPLGETPVLILTAREPATARSTAAAFHAAGLLPKPLKLDQLVGAIRAVLREAEHHRPDRIAERQARLQTDDSFRLLVDSVQDYAIYLLDPRGHVATWNPGAERIKGYRPDEVIGRHFSLFFPPEARDAGLPDEELRLAAGPAGRHEVEGWRVRRDGGRFWANAVVTALREESGELRGFAKVTRDLTARRESEQRFQHLANMVPSLVWTADADGRPAFYNERWWAYTGLRRDEAGPWAAQVHPDDREAALEAWRAALAAGQRLEVELRLRQADGAHRWFLAAAEPLRGAQGAALAWFGAFTDIHAQKLAIRRRDEFLSIVSHELKTPLTPLALHLEGLARLAARGPTVASETALSRLTTAQRQLERLGELVDRLLDVSRIAAGGPTIEPSEVDLAAVARSVAARLEAEAQASSSSVTVVADAPVVGRWDPGQLDQLVWNLVHNAVKYGRGRPVTVRVEAAGERARLVVQDEGIGVALEDQGRIFERFERAVSERHYGGLGLGLWIVKHVVAAHGGTIHLESAPGRGARFTVELPLA